MRFSFGLYRGDLQMNTAEKLNIIMNITNTTNADLGQALHFDTSYVSRIRSGKRAIPKKIPFIDLAADYLADQITEDFQKTALSQLILKGEPIPSDKNGLKLLITDYLNNKADVDIAEEPVAKLLNGMSAMMGHRQGAGSKGINVMPVSIQAAAAEPDVADDSSSVEKMSIFYGNEGKRTAIRRFLQDLCGENRPFQLLLSSDEDMTWMIEDPAYAAEWLKLLSALLQNGSRIRIIHHVNRSLAEMLNAIVQWSPLYMSGAIEPYYYPFIRDGVYRRSIFIAEGHSAVFSTSVGENTANMSNFLTYDKTLVDSLSQEFSNYFSLCKPLMQIYTKSYNNDFLAGVISKQSHGKYIMASPAPTVWSLFPEVAATMLKRYGNESFIKTHNKIHEIFIETLENGGEVTELITKPKDNGSPGNAIPVPHCDLFGCPMLSYTQEEYKMQLEKMEELSRKYSNYRVLTTDMIPHDILIYAHSERDAILSGTMPPTTAFVIRQPQLSNAFYEYLSRIEAEIKV